MPRNHRIIDIKYADPAFFAVALGAAVKHSKAASLLLLTDDENKASLSSPLAFMDQWTALRHWIEAHGLVVSVTFN